MPAPRPADKLPARGEPCRQDGHRDRRLERHRPGHVPGTPRGRRSRCRRGEACRAPRERRAPPARRHRPCGVRAIRRSRRGRARRSRHPRQRRGPRARPRSCVGAGRGGRARRVRDQRERARPHDPALPSAHPRRRSHSQPGQRGRHLGVPARGRLLCVKGRRARVHARPARGSPRPTRTRDERRSRPRAQRLLEGPVQGRRGEGRGRLRRGRHGRADEPRRRRGLHPLRPHAPPARERRRDRRHGPRPDHGRQHPARVVVALTILEGSTFCICDDLGDVGAETSGFFAEDMRFLSVLRLTIDGERPLLLSSDRIEYFSAAFFLRNAPSARLAQDTVSIMRRRFVGDAMQDVVIVQNQTSAPVRLTLACEVGTDFADIFVVKPKVAERRFGEELVHIRDSLTAWQLRVPQLRADWDALDHAVAQSVADLAALRIRSARDSGLGRLPAAGMPWFMTVFGRDTIIAGLQTILLGPELARAALEVLAELQAKDDDPTIDAEPGKIVHEVRHGKAAEAWFGRYYGTVDATPLYLVLLSEVWRWTDDAAVVRELRDPALAALEWIDRYGDRDGDGFVEYGKRAARGLDNQSWKDSGDSQLFADGRMAEPPIAPCEVQGYVYDAKLRMAEVAREVWRERKLAEQLEQDTAQLKQAFDDAYWVESRGGYYALALDREKQPVDSMCSNIGHLLWSGIVPEERVDAIVDALMGESLWSGWGVRTMSQNDAGYNPLSYHNGTVWPHDNSLI